MWGVELLVMVGMVAFNGLFAAYEIALAAISAARLHGLAEAGRPGAVAARYMKENLEGSLAGVQLGITLVGAVAAAVGGAGAGEAIAPALRDSLGVPAGAAEVLALAVVVAPLTAVTIVFGELIPKLFALRHKEWVCLRLSPPMRWFVSAVWPAVWALEAAVTGLMRLGERHLAGRLGPDARSEAAELQELRASAALARTSRLIGPQEERIILGAAALSGRPIREVMLPAAAIGMLDADATTADALTVAHLDMHTRFPVTERPGDPQGIVGYVNVKDIMARLRLAPHDPSLRAITRAIPSFPDDLPVSAVLERLTREMAHIALVRDPAGAVVGMVTLEDIIEELVGDIGDEFDRLPAHVGRAGDGWVAGGGVTPARLREATGVDLPAPPDGRPVGHLADWVAAHLPGGVRGGEVVERDGVRVVVRKVRRRKVQEAQVQRWPARPG
jgi:putative hemolysin